MKKILLSVLVAASVTSAQAQVFHIVEQGVVDNLVPGQEFFSGMDIHGLPYTRTFDVDTNSQTAHLTNFQAPYAYKELLGADASTRFTVGSESFSYAGQDNAYLTLYANPDNTKATNFVLQVSFTCDKVSTYICGEFQLVTWDINSKLPSGGNDFVVSGDYLIPYQANGNNGGLIYYDNSTNQYYNQTARFDLIPQEIIISTSSFPLPPSIWLFGTTLLGLLGLKRQNNKTIKLL